MSISKQDYTQKLKESFNKVQYYQDDNYQNTFLQKSKEILKEKQYSFSPNPLEIFNKQVNLFFSVSKKALQNELIHLYDNDKYIEDETFKEDFFELSLDYIKSKKYQIAYNTDIVIHEIFVQQVRNNNKTTKQHIQQSVYSLFEEYQAREPIIEYIFNDLEKYYSTISEDKVTLWIDETLHTIIDKEEAQEKKQELQNCIIKGQTVSWEQLKNSIDIQIKDNNFLLLKDQHSPKYIIRSTYGIDDIQIEHSVRDSIVSYLNDKICKPNDYQMEIRRYSPTGYTTDSVPLNYNQADLSVATNIKRVFKPETEEVLIETKYQIEYNEFRITTELAQKGDGSDLTENINKCPCFIRLLGNLVQDDESHLEWLLHWLSHNYQKRTKSEKSVIFLGQSGTGKGILGNVLKKIYSIYMTVDENGRLLDSHFNANLANKLYYFLDEMEDKESKHSILKAYTAHNSTFTLTKKGIDSEEAALTANFIIATNAENPIKMAEGYDDRRFNVFRATSPLKKREFVKSVSKFNKSVMEEVPHIIRLLANYPLQTQDYRDQSLNTDEWKRLAIDGKPKYQTYLDKLFSHDLSYFDEMGATGINIKLDSGKFKNGLDIIKLAMIQGKFPVRFFNKVFEGLYDETFKPMIAYKHQINGEETYLPKSDNYQFYTDLFVPDQYRAKFRSKVYKIPNYIDKSDFDDILILDQEIPLLQKEVQITNEMMS